MLIVAVWIVVLCGLVMAELVAAIKCTKADLFGQAFSFHCPQFGDDADNIWCCGSERFRYCCNELVDSSLIASLAIAVGIFAGMVVIITCFICSCCILLKRCLLKSYNSSRHSTKILRGSNHTSQPYANSSQNASVAYSVHRHSQDYIPISDAYPPPPPPEQFSAQQMALPSTYIQEPTAPDYPIIYTSPRYPSGVLPPPPGFKDIVYHGY